MFTGEPVAVDSKEVTPTTFIKKLRAHMRDLGTDNAVNPDAQKINMFPDYLVENSPAEKWFKARQASATPFMTWAALEAAFHTRFPGPEKAELTPQDGAEVFAHVHFTTRLLEIARLAGIADTMSGIWQSSDALPEVLCKKIPATQTTWVTYTNAIKDVDRIHIREGVEKAKKAQELDRRVAEIDARMPLTPLSKMTAQLSRAGMMTPRAATAPLATQAPAGGNVFGGGGGQGNLFTPPEMTEEGRTHLHRIAQGLAGSMLQDDAAGRAEYTRRITNWVRIHGGPQGTNKVLLEHTGYPLTQCQGPTIPTKESTFHSLCNKHLKEPRVRAPAPVPVNAVLEDTNWMDFVTQSVPEDFARSENDPGYPVVYNADVFFDDECEIIDIYTVGTGEEEKCEPFEHWIAIQGPKGENKNKHHMGTGRQSYKKFRMANRVIVPSQGAWHGTITVEGVRRKGAFEIFDSGGGWQFLFGKPLQTAVHDYKRDVVDIGVGDARASLANQRGTSRWGTLKPARAAGAPEAFKGVFSSAKAPVRHVPSKTPSKLRVLTRKNLQTKREL
ncbi:hypothetical protein B0H10DRAFT_2231366 [Mycena sp. CBHHK59/15]|nr:hypothetical protein B0H10DRAFT_2231366 [Mycena sp. CBHHK59/15]